MAEPIPKMNPQQISMQLSRIKDSIVVEKGRSDQNVAEAVSKGIDQIADLLTPFVGGYQQLHNENEELKKKLEKYEPKKIKTPAKKD